MTYASIVRIMTAAALLAAVLVGAATPAAATVLPDPESVGVVDTTTGRWHLWDPLAPPGSEPKTFYYGNPGDAPFVGDWDCDGTDTPGLYRRSDGYAYLRNSNTQGIADVAFYFGDPGDVPLAGDWDGDGCDTLSLYRPAEGRIYVINELGSGDAGLGAADFSFPYGDPGDVPFAGDFDGDHTDSVGLHRPSTGQVHLRNSLSAGAADLSFTFGDPGDAIVAGDWNRDDADTVAIYRDRAFHLRYANARGVADEVVILDLAAFPYRVADGATLVPMAGRFGRERPIAFSDLPCATDGYVGQDPRLLVLGSPAPPEPSDAAGVLGFTFTSSPGCDRLVIALGALPQGGAFSESAVPANHVPEGVTVHAETNRIRVRMPGVSLSRISEGLDFLAGPLGLVFREPFPDVDDLTLLAWYPAPRELSARFLSHPARIVVDARPVSTLSWGPVVLPVVGDTVVLESAVEPRRGDVFVRGWARPFEGDGPVFLTDLGTGKDAVAEFDGCTPTPEGCLYQALGHDVAWGQFTFIVRRLPPGTYELFVVGLEDMEDGSDDRGVKQVFTIP